MLGRFPVQYGFRDSVNVLFKLMFLVSDVVRMKCLPSATSQKKSHQRSRSETLNEPPLNEFQFADDKEIKVRRRHSRAEHFGWNVTSAQRKENVREALKQMFRAGMLKKKN